MSYTNQTCSSMADLFTKLEAFVSGTPGYTTHIATGSGEFAARKTASGIDTNIAVQWDTSSPQYAGLYQFLGAYNTGTNPYNQTDDSGNGALSTTDATLGGQRRVTIGNTPIQFWAFEDDYYVHVVVQTDATRYRHFGWGVLDKVNDWTGGEYVYGQAWNLRGVTSSTAVQLSSTHLLDGLCKDDSPVLNMEEYAATVHCESLPSGPTSHKYAVVMGNQGSGNLGNDRQSTPRGRAHFISTGRTSHDFGQMPGTSQAGLMPGAPIEIGYWERTSGDVYAPMGFMKDVVFTSAQYWAAGDEITVGSDTWVIFPSYRKSPDLSTINGYSCWQGIAYKKVTT